MYCRKCGGNLGEEPEGKFCPFCGVAFEEDAASTMNQEEVIEETTEEMVSPEIQEEIKESAKEQSDSVAMGEKTLARKKKRKKIILGCVTGFAGIVLLSTLLMFVAYMQGKTIRDDLRQNENVILEDEENILISSSWEDVKRYVVYEIDAEDKRYYGVRDYEFNEVLPIEYDNIYIGSEYIIATKNSETYQGSVCLYDLQGYPLNDWNGYYLYDLESGSRDALTDSLFKERKNGIILLQKGKGNAEENHLQVAVVNTKGNVLVEYEAQKGVYYGTASDSYVTIGKNNGYDAYIYDRSGNFVNQIQAQYGGWSLIGEKYIRLGKFVDKVKLYTVVDVNGENFLDYQYFEVLEWNDGYFRTKETKDGEAVLYRTDGTQEPIYGYDDIVYLGKESDSFKVEKDGKAGIMTRERKMLIPLEYDNIFMSSTDDETWCYVCVNCIDGEEREYSYSFFSPSGELLYQCDGNIKDRDGRYGKSQNMVFVNWEKNSKEYKVTIVSDSGKLVLEEVLPAWNFCSFSEEGLYCSWDGSGKVQVRNLDYPYEVTEIEGYQGAVRGRKLYISARKEGEFPYDRVYAFDEYGKLKKLLEVPLGKAYIGELSSDNSNYIRYYTCVDSIPLLCELTNNHIRIQIK